jgi:hypothetical protein
LVRRSKIRGRAEASRDPAAARVPPPLSARLVEVQPGAAVLRAISEASLLTRSSAPEGEEHLLAPREKKRFETLYPRLPARSAERIEALLEGFDGENAPVARSLILRAVLARMTRLLALRSAKDQHAILEVVERFAQKMRPLDRADLLRRASVLDLDSTSNTSAEEPLDLWKRRGVIHADHTSDEDSTNDGLIQRFTASCGPTVIEMMAAQADPVFAFAILEAGLGSESAHDATAAFQRLLLEHYGGIAIGLPEALLRSRVKNALGRLERDRHLARDDGEAMLRYLTKGAKLTRGAAHALEVVRERFDGFPSATELKALRRRRLPDRDEGIGYGELASALERYVSPLTGVYYRQTNPPEGFGRGRSRRHLDEVARALRSGVDVPFGLSEPSHWMLMSAVDGRKPNRRFLVSDPASGRTEWVREEDVVSGVFADRQFQLCTDGQRGYIDSFYLPEAGTPRIRGT